MFLGYQRKRSCQLEKIHSERSGVRTNENIWDCSLFCLLEKVILDFVPIISFVEPSAIIKTLNKKEGRNALEDLRCDIWILLLEQGLCLVTIRAPALREDSNLVLSNGSLR